MILERVQLEAFGHFRRAELGLKPGLNILVGPNAAGKSTLLAFIRAILFGFENKNSPYGRYTPQDGSNLAGELEVQTRLGHWNVRRVAGKRQSGELSVRDAHTGAAVLPQLLTEGMEGVSRELFFEVFAFGLTELEDFNRLTKQGAVSQALFAAGMGAKLLPSALKTLEDAAGRVYAYRGQRPLNLVLKELGEVTQELARLGDRPALYQAAQQRLAERQVELEDLERTQKTSVAALRERETLLRVAQDVRNLVRLEAQWSGESKALETFPFAAVAGLDAQQAQLGTARGELARVSEQRKGLRGAQGALPVPQNTDAAAAALSVWTGGTDLRQSLGERRARLGQQHAQAQASLEDLGLGLLLDLGSLRGLDLGPTLRTELAELSENGRRRETEDAASTSRTEELGREAARLTLERESVQARTEAAQGPSRDVLLLQRRQLNDVQAAAADLARRRAAREQLELQAPAVLEELPWTRPLVGLREALGFLVIGLVLSLVAGGLFGLRMGAVVGTVFGMLAIFLGLLARKDQARVDAGNARERVRREGHRVARARHTEKVAEAERAVELAEETAARIARSLDMAWPLDGNALASLAQTVEEGLRRAEDRERLGAERSRLDAREAELAGMEQELVSAAKRRHEQGNEELTRLRALLTARSLPGELSARAAVQLVQELLQLQARVRELDVEAAALGAREQEREQAFAALRAAAATLGIDSGEVETLAPRLRARVQELARAEAERVRLAARLTELDAELAQWAAQERALTERQTELLAHAGCASLDALRERASALEALRQVRTQSRELRQKVEGALGCHAEQGASALEALGGVEQAELGRHALDQVVAEQSTRLKALLEDEAALRAEIRKLETDAEVSTLREREEYLIGRAKELAQRFAEDRLAHQLLDRAKRGHERERQPAVVQTASRYFSQLTQGAYPRVFTELEAPETLLALDVQGHRWKADELSRGTREQLYLAFRLALVEDFSARRGPLPVLVDDILVNFDPERTALAVNALRELSLTNQVIGFTCHPHVAKLWTEAGAHEVDVRRLVEPSLFKRTA